MKTLIRNCLVVILAILVSCSVPEQENTADVCVYGGTASGMMAAIAAARQDKSVIVVEPTRWLGGMVGGGIRVLRDCRHAEDIGGLTRMMIERDIEIGGGIHDRQGEFRKAFEELADEYGIRVIYEHRLGKTEKEGNRITKIYLDFAPPEKDGCPAGVATTVNAQEITAKVFIDASYEGDLLAQAGVSYVVDKESSDQYGESLAGERNIKTFDVDPYVIPGDPSSGLLPLISKEPAAAVGSASRYILAYNFRLQWVTPGEGTPVGDPDHYDSDQYELVRRALESDPASISWPHANYQRTGLMSGGIPGRQADYPDGTWEERAKIWREWIDHVKIMHKVTGSKQELKKGEYPDSDDFPHQLYIRLARRMVGPYVLTQHDVMGQTDIDDPIGLGYGWNGTIDIYPSRLVATADGKVASGGELFPRVCPGPYKIPYRSITPKKEECGNLLVSVCISGTHIAMANVRMEPTYMLMGESAGIAAVNALDEDADVQDIDMRVYHENLLAAGQILEWDGTGYGNYGKAHFEVWWNTHPEEYRNYPVSTLLKGPREPSEFIKRVERARRGNIE